jgi:hypothetical protein
MGTIFSRIVALQSRRDFWEAQLEQANALSRPILAVIPAKFVVHYERKIASIMAKQDLHMPQ